MEQNKNEIPKWIGMVSRYFLILYDTNKKVIRLSSLDACGDEFIIENLFMEIVQNICRLVPYYKLKDKEKVYLSTQKEGILSFKKDITYLENEYKELFKNNYDTFLRVKKIRNKVEHSVHEVKFNCCYSGSTSLPEIGFKIKKQTIMIKTEELVEILKSLNDLFEKLVCDMKNIAFQFGETDHPYIEKYTKFSFKRFNGILNSNLLKDIGRIMMDF